MKLSQYYPYILAIVLSVVVYLTLAFDLADMINHFIIFFSSLLFLLIIARFFCFRHTMSFLISLVTFVIGIGFLYYVIYFSPYTALKVRGLGYPIYFSLSIIGVIIGYLISRKKN